MVEVQVEITSDEVGTLSDVAVSQEVREFFYKDTGFQSVG